MTTILPSGMPLILSAPLQMIYRLLSARVLMMVGILLPGLCTASSDSEDMTDVYRVDPPYFVARHGISYLNPRNDSRINLMLLLEDKWQVTWPVYVSSDDGAQINDLNIDYFPYTEQQSEEASAEDALSQVAAALGVPSEELKTARSRLDEYGWDRPGRCVSDTPQSLEETLHALVDSVSDKADQTVLAIYRVSVAGRCDDLPEDSVALNVTTDSARQWTTYFNATRLFYRGQFQAAEDAYVSLAGAAVPWVAEASVYMLARTHLNRAQENVTEQWSGMRAEVDGKALESAAAAFKAYTARYSSGRYLASAQGLLRRVAWLQQHDEEYLGQLRLALEKVTGADAASSLVQESDKHVWPLNDQGRPEFQGKDEPLFLAADLLMQMRDGENIPQEKLAILKNDIAASSELFNKAGLASLHRYLLVANRYFVERAYDEVVKDTEALTLSDKLSHVDFSLFVVRALALGHRGDHAAASRLWRSLAQHARDAKMHDQAGIGLAVSLHAEKLSEQAFVAESGITDFGLRQLLIVGASPQSLEYILSSAEAQGGGHLVRPSEVQLILNVVALRYLSTGRYRDALDFSIRHKKSADDCEDCLFYTLKDVVATLVKKPNDNPSRLRLADVLGANARDYRYFVVPTDDKDENFSPDPAAWTGQSLSTVELYQRVMADSRATRDEVAHALSGAINCYWLGYDHCGPTNVPQEQRKAWFSRLKRKFADTSWAQNQKYYW